MSAGEVWYLNGENNNLSYEKEIKAQTGGGSYTEHKHYLSAGGIVFAMQITRSGSLGSGPSAKPASSLQYLHHDSLGSVAVVTDDTGSVTERMAYDPWGKRRFPNGLADTQDSIVGLTLDRGFTMHEHLDEMGIIHMNGRVFDPLIGRFMSADPNVTYPYWLQSFNRYAYVLNNPLNMVDPTGFDPDSSDTSHDVTLAPVIVYANRTLEDYFPPQSSSQQQWANGRPRATTPPPKPATPVKPPIPGRAILNFVPSVYFFQQALDQLRNKDYGLAFVSVWGAIGDLGLALVTGGESRLGVRAVQEGAERLMISLTEREAALQAARAGVNGSKLALTANQAAEPEESNGKDAAGKGQSEKPPEQEISPADRAKGLGYDRKVKDPPFNSHGQPVFGNGRDFITPDVDQHNGGEWKGFDRRGRRTGTYDQNLNWIGK